MIRENSVNKKPFDNFSSKITKLTGLSWSLAMAVILVVVWALSGPVFHFSNTWQLVINAGT